MNAPGPAIRPAVPADAERLAAFAERTFRDAFGAANSPENMALYVARTYGVERQGAEIADPGIATLLAEVEGELAGYAQLREGDAPDCVTGAAPIELWRFYVDRAWHGRGVAQRLMAAVDAEARRRGAATLWLGVWEANPRARAFYAKCGFVDVGSQSFVLGADVQRDRVMARPVAA